MGVSLGQKKGVKWFPKKWRENLDKEDRWFKCTVGLSQIRKQRPT